MNEKILTGIPISKGFAVGKVIKLGLLDRSSVNNGNSINVNISTEIDRFNNVINELTKESQELIEKFKHKGKIKSILESELMFFGDSEFINSIENIIQEGNNCKVALEQFFESTFFNVKAYNQSSGFRLNEISILKQKILQKLDDKQNNYAYVKNRIVATNILDSNNVLKIYESKPLGLITEFGSNLSHSSVISRSLNIPAVFGLNNLMNEIENGDTIVIDGIYGNLIINPTQKTITKYRKKQKEFELEMNSKIDLRTKHIKNKKGQKIKFLSNINNLIDLENTLSNDADGVGLVRTENLITKVEDILYIERQYELYNKIAESLYPKPVTFRLFDFGNDKLNLNIEKEVNPALGLRGIRYLLNNEKLLEIQLEALIKASKNGNLRILIPMVTKINELDKIKDWTKKIADKLSIYPPKLGIMIETPVVAFNSKEFIAKADFLNIGTNDLLQYFFVADRNNTLVNSYLDSLDKDFISLLSKIKRNCEKANKELIVCGQMSSDVASFMLLFKRGFTNFSIVPTRIKLLKKLLVK